MAFWFVWKLTSFPFVLYVFGCGVLHVLFLHLMKAPTFAGRRVMDQVEGFKMFWAQLTATGSIAPCLRSKHPLFSRSFCLTQ